MNEELQKQIDDLKTEMREHYHEGLSSRQIWYKNIWGLPTAGYGGHVASGGTATHLPSGWTSAKTGTGQYTVTHNLGSANYSAIAMSYGASSFCKFNAVNANDVQFVFLDATGNLNDSEFYFILITF